MKLNSVHPAYGPLKVTCMNCGNHFETSSTLKGDLTIDICSNCHPVSSGKPRALANSSRLDQFRLKYGARALSH